MRVEGNHAAWAEERQAVRRRTPAAGHDNTTAQLSIRILRAEALQSVPDPQAPTMQALDAVHSYHAHIYYDPARTRGVAEALRARIDERFRVQLGRWHDVPVGPHTAAMYQLAFGTELFASLVPWLMLNRDGLDVLVHPNTLAPRDDHLQHALWLGQVLPLREDVLPLRIDADQESPIEPNTAPTLAP
jgi:aromatic ring-cleaving dioxygenase